MADISPLLPGAVFLAVIAAGVVALIRKAISETRQKDEARRIFTTAQGWQYSSEGNQNFRIASNNTSPFAWEITTALGEDTASTTWRAPALNVPQCVLMLRKRQGRSTLTSEQRAAAEKVLTWVARTGILPGNPQNLLLTGNEYPLERHSLRDVFTLLAYDRAVAEALITPTVEDALCRFMASSGLPQAEKEALAIELGPKGLSVALACIPDAPESLLPLVELGRSLAQAFVENRVARLDARTAA